MDSFNLLFSKLNFFFIDAKIPFESFYVSSPKSFDSYKVTSDENQHRFLRSLDLISVEITSFFINEYFWPIIAKMIFGKSSTLIMLELPCLVFWHIYCLMTFSKGQHEI